MLTYEYFTNIANACFNSGNFCYTVQSLAHDTFITTVYHSFHRLAGSPFAQACKHLRLSRLNSFHFSLNSLCTSDTPVVSSICFSFNPLNAELNPICCLLALLGAHHFLHVSRIRVKSLTLRLLMSYIYIYTEHPFLMFLDHTQQCTTVGRTPLDE